MGRRLYVIPVTMDRELAYEQAKANNCPEIASGISPRIAKDTNIKEEDLPMVYEEPIIPVKPQRDYGKELDELKDKVKKLEGNGRLT